MCQHKRSLWKTGIVITSLLFLLIFLVGIPATVASASERVSGLVTSGTVIMQATPTVDATVTSLSKELLTQQVAAQQHTWDNWFWSNSATILSTLVIVVGALVGLWRWRRDQQAELEKRTEERFQAAVTGLGDDKEGTRIGAAILLRTFLRPGYEQFHLQIFDLAVANLRLPRASDPPNDSNTPLPLTTLSQALIVIFKEVFPLAQSQEKRGSQFLDAGGIQLDNANMRGAKLKNASMPQVSLRKANLKGVDFSGASLFKANLSEASLTGANLSEASLISANLSKSWLRLANLYKANLSRAKLIEANLSGADLHEANLGEADLMKANLSNAVLHKATLIEVEFHKAKLIEADLSEANLSESNLFMVDFSGASLFKANLSGADLRQANLTDARSLKGANLFGVKGLTKEQLEACKAKGAIIEGETTTSVSQPPVAPTLPIPTGQANTLDKSSVAPSQLGSET